MVLWKWAVCGCKLPWPLGRGLWGNLVRALAKRCAIPVTRVILAKAVVFRVSIPGLKAGATDRLPDSGNSICVLNLCNNLFFILLHIKNWGGEGIFYVCCGAMIFVSVITPVVFGIRRIQPPLFEKKRGACCVALIMNFIAAFLEESYVG